MVTFLLLLATKPLYGHATSTDLELMLCLEPVADSITKQCIHNWTCHCLRVHLSIVLSICMYFEMKCIWSTELSSLSYFCWKVLIWKIYISFSITPYEDNIICVVEYYWYKDISQNAEHWSNVHYVCRVYENCEKDIYPVSLKGPDVVEFTI